MVVLGFRGCGKAVCQCVEEGLFADSLKEKGTVLWTVLALELEEVVDHQGSQLVGEHVEKNVDEGFLTIGERRLRKAIGVALVLLITSVISRGT